MKKVTSIPNTLPYTVIDPLMAMWRPYNGINCSLISSVKDHYLTATSNTTQTQQLALIISVSSVFLFKKKSLNYSKVGGITHSFMSSLIFLWWLETKESTTGIRIRYPVTQGQLDIRYIPEFSASLTLYGHHF